MFEVLCVATGLVIALTAIAAYLQWRDAFHPAVVTAPMFGFMLSVSPLLLYSTGDLDIYFSSNDLEYVQLIYLTTMVCFCIGLLSVYPRRLRGGWQRIAVSPLMARRLYRLAIALGCVSVAAYVYMIENVGGFVEAYSPGEGWWPRG